MCKFMISLALAGAVVAGFAGASKLYAQEQQNHMHGMGGPMMGHGMMGGGTEQQPMNHEMMHRGMSMMCPMMQGRAMMQGGMMGSPTMQSGMGGGGMDGLFGSRVTPQMNLSVEDVRGYLGAQLERLNNKRLKIGEIKNDDGTITADIVTADNSLVQRLKVDRHSGAITYEN